MVAFKDTMSLLNKHTKGQRKSVQNLSFAWDMITIQLPDAKVAELRSSLTELTQRSWFRRVWIIQEVGSARVASVLCGDKSISSSIFSAMPLIMELQPDPQAQAVLDIMPGPLRQHSWWNADRRLLKLLAKFIDSEATREHDRIYALLGVASDAPNVPIDYGCPFQTVVARTASLLAFGTTAQSFLLQDERSLDYFQVFRGVTHTDMVIVRLFELALKFNEKDLFEHLTESSAIRGIADDAITEYKWDEPYFRSIFYSFAGRDKKDAPSVLKSIFKDALANGHHLVCNKIRQLEGVLPSEDHFQQLLPSMSSTDFREIVMQKCTLNGGDYLGQMLGEVIPDKGILNDILYDVARYGRGEQLGILWGLGADSHSFLTEPVMGEAIARENVETTRYLLRRHETDGWPVYEPTLATRRLWQGLRLYSREPLLHLLIDYGADIMSSQQGETPLRYAVVSNNYLAVRVLIKRGADYKSPDKYGQTSLHIAEEKDNRGIVAMLLAHGADPLALHEDGRTPWQLNKDNTSEEETRNAAQLEGCLYNVSEPQDREVIRQALLLLGKDKEDDFEDQSKEATDTNLHLD
ncbi:heterokaryon incompatibility protein-domain-containing protein [Apiospora saccharicola]